MIPNVGIDDLTSRIYERRPQETDAPPSDTAPYVLFLGDGCSEAAGVPKLPQIAARAMQMFGLAKTATGSPHEELVGSFLDTITSMKKEQVARMMQMIFASIPVPSFYQQLAQLVRERFFPLIITTNYDTLLEQALDSVGFRAFDYRVTTFDGVTPISTSTGGGSELVHIVKLHGDLARQVIHFTPEAVDSALRSSRQFVKSELRGDLIMVGFSFGDEAINSWLSHSPSREVWWVAPKPPDNPQVVSSWAQEWHEISGTFGNPSIFFAQLSLRLLRLTQFRVRGQERSISQTPDDESFSAALPQAPAELGLADTLQGEIRRAQNVLYALEQSAPVGLRPSDVQAQIAYQKKQMSVLEEKMWSLEDVKPAVIEVVTEIRDDILKADLDQSNNFHIGDSLRKYLFEQVDTVSHEMTKEKPDRFLVSASLSATLALADRVTTDYGSSIIRPNNLRRLAEFAPLAAGRVIV
ncbi:MAG TPA: SIR2 family protein [Thermoanaerobaculia bacterium]|nr:SIR2 family protein [Thermoanaerobaculia bacterium]